MLGSMIAPRSTFARPRSTWLVGFAGLGLISTLISTLIGCSDLSEFRTGPESVYRGEVMGTELGSFIRRGFSAGTVLEMTFDPDDASTSPGVITTRSERLESECGLEPTFESTPLLAIQALAHDQLSLYDFPGAGRVRNYVFALQPETGPLAGRDAMAFVSLMEGGHVEVRLISGSGARDCESMACGSYAAGRCDYFGVFRLDEENR